MEKTKKKIEKPFKCIRCKKPCQGYIIPAMPILNLGSTVTHRIIQLCEKCLKEEAKRRNLDGSLEK